MGGTPVNLFGPQVQRPSMFDSLLQRFAIGMQIGGTIRQANQEAEERKLRAEMLKHQINTDKLNAEIEKRMLPLKIAQMLHGQPGQMQQSEAFALDREVGAPSGGMLSEMRQEEQPHPTMTANFGDLIPGMPPVSVQPMNRTQSLEQSLMEMFRKGRMEADTAGMKAGAVADAEQPYKAAIEQLKAQTDLEKQRGQQEFTAGENAKNRANSTRNAQIAAGNQTVTVETVENGKHVTKVLPRSEAVGKTFEKPPTGEARNRQDASGMGLQALDDIEKMFKPAYVGPAAGRMYGLQEQAGIGVDPARSEFVSTVAAFNNQVINQLSGANVPPAEFARLRQQLPQVTDPPAVFKSKVNSTRRNLQRLGGQGITSSATVGPTATDPKTGKRVQWNGSAWVPVQ